MISKNFLGASSKCSTKDLLLDNPSSESTISTMTWATATSRVWSLDEPASRAYQWLSQLVEKYCQEKDRVLIGLGSLQLFLKLGFLLFKALDLQFHVIKLSRMFSVSFIKLIPSSERLIKALGNFCILVGQSSLIVNSMIQSLRFKEGSIGNILQVQQMMGILRWIDCWEECW